MFSMSIQSDRESVSNTHKNEADFLSDSATMFILSMVMTSVLVMPAIIASTQATAIWRLLKKW